MRGVMGDCLMMMVVATDCVVLVNITSFPIIHPKKTTQAKSARMNKSAVQEKKKKKIYIGNLATILECTYYQ